MCFYYDTWLSLLEKIRVIDIILLRECLRRTQWGVHDSSRDFLIVTLRQTVNRQSLGLLELK